MSRQCSRCGCIGAKPVEVYHEDKLLVEGVMCDACFDDAMSQFEEFQSQFEQLIASGVHPRMANRIMQQRIPRS